MVSFLCHKPKFWQLFRIEFAFLVSFLCCKPKFRKLFKERVWVLLQFRLFPDNTHFSMAVYVLEWTLVLESDGLEFTLGSWTSPLHPWGLHVLPQEVWTEINIKQYLFWISQTVYKHTCRGQILHKCWFLFVFIITFLKEYFEVHTNVPFNVLSFNDLLDVLATY